MKITQGWTAWAAVASGLLMLWSPACSKAADGPNQAPALIAPPAEIAVPAPTPEEETFPPAVVPDYKPDREDDESLRDNEPGIVKLDEAKPLFAPVMQLAPAANDFPSCGPIQQAWHDPVLYPHDTYYAPTGFGLLDWYRCKTAGFQMAMRERMLIQDYNNRVDWACQSRCCDEWSCWGHMCDDCCGLGCRTFVLTMPECLFHHEEHCPAHHCGHQCDHSSGHYWDTHSHEVIDHSADAELHSSVARATGIQLVSHTEAANGQGSPGVYRLGQAAEVTGIVRLGESTPAPPAPTATPSAPPAPAVEAAPVVTQPAPSVPTAPMMHAAPPVTSTPCTTPGCTTGGCSSKGCATDGCLKSACGKPGCTSCTSKVPCTGCAGRGCQSCFGTGIGGCRSGGCENGRWCKRRDLFGNEFYRYERSMGLGSLFCWNQDECDDGRGNGGRWDDECNCPLCCMRRQMAQSCFARYGLYSRVPWMGTYRLTYPVNPWYSDARDHRVYAAGATGAPTAVPLAPNVEHTYNYGWGVPSSRLTPVSRGPGQLGIQPLTGPTMAP